MIKINSIYILIFLISLLFLYSCEKEDINSGLIICEHDFGECFVDIPKEPGAFDKKEYIITDDSSYQAIELSVYTSKSQCLNPQKPSVDFSKYSLLGKYAEGGGNVRMKREVIDNKSNLQYIYKIKVKGCAFFSTKLAYDMNWVLVPKLPPGYNVKFEVEYSIFCK